MYTGLSVLGAEANFSLDSQLTTFTNRLNVDYWFQRARFTPVASLQNPQLNRLGVRAFVLAASSSSFPLPKTVLTRVQDPTMMPACQAEEGDACLTIELSQEQSQAGGGFTEARYAVRIEKGQYRLAQVLQCDTPSMCTAVSPTPSVTPSFTPSRTPSATRSATLTVSVSPGVTPSVTSISVSPSLSGLASLPGSTSPSGSHALSPSTSVAVSTPPLVSTAARAAMPLSFSLIITSVLVVELLCLGQETYF